MSLSADVDAAVREPTYAGYADETRYNVGRYRGVALVSAPCALAPTLVRECSTILADSGVGECKWEKVRSARTRFAAEKLLVWTVHNALAGRLHVDTLTWDADEVSRAHQAHQAHQAHDYRGPAARPVPYLRKLHLMYADLLAAALTSRWPDGRPWVIYPDEQNALRWPLIAAASPRVARVEPRVSGDEPLIQLADLFAGLAVFSRAGYATYERWLCLPEEERRTALPASVALRAISGSDRQRCLLLDGFYTRCKLQQLGVSLRTWRGLRTYDPNRPLTFRWADDRPYGGI